MIKYSITTYFPQTHIQVCYLIGATGSLIDEAHLSADESYYGKFVITGGIDSFDKFSDLPDVKLDLIT